MEASIRIDLLGMFASMPIRCGRFRDVALPGLWWFRETKPPQTNNLSAFFTINPEDPEI